MRSLVLASYNATFVFNAKRMPALGETLAADEFRYEHGGKGSNQAIGIRRLGSSTRIIASVGTDAFGDAAVKKWTDEGVDVSGVHRAHGSTGIAVVVVLPGGRNAIIISRNANERLPRDHVFNIIRSTSYDVFMTVFEIDARLALEAAREASERSLTVLNPAPAIKIEPKEVAGITALTPNESEFKVMLGFPPEADIEFERYAARFLDYVEIVAITLAERGALIITRNRVELVKPFRTEPVDVTGAGDAWNAAFAYMLGRGEDPFFAAEFANAAAAFLISRRRADKALVENLPYEKEVYEILQKR